MQSQCTHYEWKNSVTVVCLLKLTLYNSSSKLFTTLRYWLSVERQVTKCLTISKAEWYSDKVGHATGSSWSSALGSSSASSLAGETKALAIDTEIKGFQAALETLPVSLDRVHGCLGEA